MELFGNILGGIGVCFFLVSYFLLQKGTWKPDSPAYLLSNLFGALLVLGSLLIDWNLPAFLLEVAWALISIYGLLKYIRKR